MTKTLVAAPEDDFERRWWLYRLDYLMRVVIGFRKV